MIDPLPVIIPEAGRAAELARVVLSSLPLSYASNGEHGSGAVIIIDGQTTAWPTWQPKRSRSRPPVWW